MHAQQTQWLGTIRIGRPLSCTVMTVASIGMVAALLAFAALGDMSRKVTVHGLLLPKGGLIHVTATQPGVVAELLAREGDSVMAGQPIARVRTERITQSGDSAALAMKAIETRRASLIAERRLTDQGQQQRQDAIAHRLQSLQSEDRHAQGELEATRSRVQLARKSLARDSDLAKSGFVAAAQVQQRQEELIDLQVREGNVERNLQALQRDLQAARAESHRGLHSDRPARLSPLCSLPEPEVWNGTWRSDCHQSQPHFAQYLPSGQAQAQAQALLAATQTNEPLYRISVRIPSQTVDTYGRQSQLTAGMSIDADIRLDTRRIWEWVLEPALAISRW